MYIEYKILTRGRAVWWSVAWLLGGVNRMGTEIWIIQNLKTVIIPTYGITFIAIDKYNALEFNGDMCPKLYIWRTHAQLYIWQTHAQFDQLNKWQSMYLPLVFSRSQISPSMRNNPRSQRFWIPCMVAYSDYCQCTSIIGLSAISRKKTKFQNFQRGGATRRTDKLIHMQLYIVRWRKFDQMYYSMNVIKLKQKCPWVHNKLFYCLHYCVI